MKRFTAKVVTGLLIVFFVACLGTTRAEQSEPQAKTKVTLKTLAAQVTALQAQVSANESAGEAIATASIDGSVPAIRAFGGSETTSASVTSSGFPGGYEITFTGKYPTSISASSLILSSSAESARHAISDAIVATANTTSIVIDVFTSDPATETFEDNNCFVAVFFGG